ncbi:hypothetical protein ACOSQ2_021763 [Xanthoceras sorbifolium]
MQDGVTMMIKTYNDNHECFRVYENDEVKEHWIASKFEALVKSNLDVKVGVIADILGERYHVNVDLHQLYKAKKKKNALNFLARDHAECFKDLKRYAFMVMQLTQNQLHTSTCKIQNVHFRGLWLVLMLKRVGSWLGASPLLV